MAVCPRPREIDCDVLVIGAGVAGLFAAIEAGKLVDRVVLVDKAKIGRSGCSPFAAGIYDACFPSDNLDEWVRELVVAGEYLNDQEWVRQHCQNTYEVVRRLDKWAENEGKQIFRQDEAGNFWRGKSRGHIHTSHLVFDALAAIDTLRRKAREEKVNFVERTVITDLVTDSQGRLRGALGFNYRQGIFYLFLARAVVAAAGGCGYKSIFLGHKNLTGDIQAAAFRAGATLKNMEFTSSNTCHRDYDTHGMNLFVHVGGRFINSLGEDFMWKYRPDLGPKGRRQDLCLAFCREVKEGRGPIYLDLSAANEEGKKLCRQILPETFKAWERAGVDPFDQPMEWVPAFYGTLSTSGGIDIDLNCATSLEGLFAAGDASCSPANGAGGPGGAAYPYASVSGFLAGGAAGRYAREKADQRVRGERLNQVEENLERFVRPVKISSGLTSGQLVSEMQKVLFPFPVSFLKNRESLEHALSQIEMIKERCPDIQAKDGHELVKAWEANNMIELAELFLKTSLMRTESRGFHFREDFPRTDNVNWLKWICWRKKGKDLETWTRDIPTPYVKPENDYETPPGIIRT